VSVRSPEEYEQLHNEFEGMATLSMSEYCDVLEDFLDISRRRVANRTALYHLQLSMFTQLVEREAMIRRAKQMIRDIEARSPSGVKQGESEIADLQKGIFLNRLHANAIRAIGDGIAWRALGYDRAVTRVMSERETKQNLLSEGTEAELSEFSRCFYEGRQFPILNALTNCLAIGDLTVIGEDGSTEIIEVKTSNAKSRRKIRQKQSMREVVTLLSLGCGATEDKQVSIHLLPITPETGLPILRELLAESEIKGWAARRVSNCLYVEVFDLRNVGSFENIALQVEATRKGACADWNERQEFVIEMRSVDVLSFTPNCAPFSVFPFPSRTCIDLLVGAKIITTYLNEDAVVREFEYLGWEVTRPDRSGVHEIRDQKELAKALEHQMTIRKGPFFVNVPPGDIARLQFECLRVKSLSQGYEAFYRQGPTGTQGYSLSIYEGESSIWS
jgi:hypothetical protein